MNYVKDEDIILEELNDALRKIGARELEITDFEKMFILAANDGAEINEFGYRDDQLDSVTDLAQYLQEKKGAKIKTLSSDEATEIADIQDMLDKMGRNDVSNTLRDYYMRKQEVTSKDADTPQYSNDYKLLDADSNSMYFVNSEGKTMITRTLYDAVSDYLSSKYSNAMKEDKISIEEVVSDLNPGTIEEVSILLSRSNLYIRNVGRVIDQLVEEKNIQQGLSDEDRIRKDEPKEEILENEIGKSKEDKSRSAIDDRAKEDEGIETTQSELEEYEVPSKDKDKTDIEESEEELTPEDEEILNEIENAGVQENAIRKVARDNGVDPALVNIRLLGTRAAMDYVEELTGANLQQYRGDEVMVVRIPRVGEQDRIYLANAQTGERINIRGREHERTISEAEQVMKYKWRPGLDTIKSMQVPSERDGQIVYMDYNDVNGNRKQARFINNGKQQDLNKKQRDAYLKEVEIANEKIRDAIKEHEDLKYEAKKTGKEHDPIMESKLEKAHKNVVVAMNNRIRIDKSYGVLSQQREKTEETLENSTNIIEGSDHEKIDKPGKIHDHDHDSHFPEPPGERSLWD